jgi:hypothetical protein
MPYVPLIQVGRIVMTWIWSFSCDVSMKNVLKFVWVFGFFFLVSFGFKFKCRSGNPGVCISDRERFSCVGPVKVRG